jgi:BirA family biotin operon repressor/biotin-[acetyl-CoA-carboxylase] ligase
VNKQKPVKRGGSGSVGGRPSLGPYTQVQSRIFYAYDVTRLRPALKPFRLYWFPVVRSTNDHAAELRSAGKLYAPAVVLAGNQRAGRGRGNNTWWSRPGCITATFVFPIDEQVQPHQIPLLAGLGVRNAVAELTGKDDEIQLKWPNDVLYKGLKLAGLLCERKEKADLVGIGLNVNVDPQYIPDDLAERITAMSIFTGELHDLTIVLATVAKHVRALVTHQAERPFGSVLREYDSHHALVGKRVSVDVGSGEQVSGKCEGLDKDGRLIVRGRGKPEHVIAGHVTTV